jgi:hypothetical protein
MPPLAVALIAGGLGVMLLAPHLTPGSVLPVGLFAVLLFVAMMTFKRARGWNAGLMAGFSFVGIGVVSWLFEARAGGTWLGAIAAAAIILALAAVLGRSTGPRMVGLSPWLWLLSWVYLFGWVAAAVLGPSAGWIHAWAIGGLVVYAGLGAAWFAGLDPLVENPSGTGWAIDIYLLGINLAIAARVAMWRG